MLSRHLEQTLHRAVAYATVRHHELATPEHLLLALTEDDDAVAVMSACGVDIDLLRQELTRFIDAKLQHLVYFPSKKALSGFLRRLRGTASNEAVQDNYFQRIVERACINSIASNPKKKMTRSEIRHVLGNKNKDAEGEKQVTGAHVLVSIFSEKGSKAVSFLQAQGMTRFDAVTYISHCIGKGQQQTAVTRNAGEGASNASCTVRLLNDDYTPMDFVVHLLEKFFEKSRQEATEIMLQIHRAGMGICGTYPCPMAATKASMVMDYIRKNEHPLQCIVEKE